MSSEALLENPAVFFNKICDLDKLALEYLDLCEKFEEEKYIKPHLFKILYKGLQVNFYFSF